MIHLVTYSAPNMTRSREVCVDAARRNGCDAIHEFDIDDISNEFYNNNKSILDAPRGLGYWLQKPYFINKVITNSANIDYLIYCDAGCELITNVNEIISRMDQDIFLFSNGHQHIDWCKMDVIEAIIPGTIANMTVASFTQLQQVQASLIFFRINAFTRNFIREWLLWCQMPGFIDDSPSKLPNHPEFAEHRYDQAILTCLQIKYGFKLHWWPDKKWYLSQRFRWPNDTYPPMLLHHRYRNKGEGKGEIEWP
jgi:hypothetical protein